MDIENILERIKKIDDSKVVIIKENGFFKNHEYGLDSTFFSDRGLYRDLCLGVKKIEKYKYFFTVRDLRILLLQALSQNIMIGYKGGEFQIDCDTRVKVGFKSVGGYVIEK